METTNIEIRLGSEIWIRQSDLPEGVLKIFRERLTFRNPVYNKIKKWGKGIQGKVPEQYTAIREGTDLRYHEEGEIIIAKGYLEEVIRILHAHRCVPELFDQVMPVEEAGYPDDGPFMRVKGFSNEQSWALSEIERHRFGIIEGPPGSGRRICLVRYAVRKKLPMLVIVQTIPDLYAWRDIAVEGSGILPDKIGTLGDGKRVWGEEITIAIYRSLMKEAPTVRGIWTGLLVLDRCDEAPLRQIFQTRICQCAAQWGVATGPREDGLTRLMEAFIGPRVVLLKGPDEGELPELVITTTGFDGVGSMDWKELTRDLYQDQDRNDKIVTDILQDAAIGLRCLVVSDRLNHLEEIMGMVEAKMGPEAEIISSHTGKEGLERILGRFTRGSLRILGVTFRSVTLLDRIEDRGARKEEGGNRKEEIGTRKGEREVKIGALFIAAPVKGPEYLLRLVGKMKRTQSAESKAHSEERKEGGVIYEYRDSHPMLRASLRRRVKVYRRMGIK